MILNLPDLAKKIGTFPTDLGQPDWSKALQTALQIGTKPGQTPLIPNGTHGDPTIVRIPELYNAVSPIAPYRATARHIHLIADEGAGFHFKTLGPLTNLSMAEHLEMAERDPGHCVKLKAYRTRFLLGPVGGHGWKYQGILRGPKLPGMPQRSPSGPGARNCLEAQAAFAARDFGRDRTEAERDAGVLGWDLSLCDFGWVWGDAIDPQTIKPNDQPNEGLYAAGLHVHDLGRHGVGIDAISDWHITWSRFGKGIPSTILHAETGGGPNTLRNARLDSSIIESGGYTVHVSGETAQLDGLTLDRVMRTDRQHAVSIDAGPPLEDGTRRARNITVTNNTHTKWIDGGKLGYYQLCQDVTHTGNSGPVPKKLNLSRSGTALYEHGSVRCTFGPNDYRRMAR